jgi:hypothetical protein
LENPSDRRHPIGTEQEISADYEHLESATNNGCFFV